MLLWNGDIFYFSNSVLVERKIFSCFLFVGVCVEETGDWERVERVEREDMKDDRACK